MTETTKYQVELMQHALGISERNREPYRNFFHASPGHSDNSDLELLVAAGLMTSRAAPSFCADGDVVYHVTDAGKDLAISALPAPKKRTRYGEYLHDDYGNSFAEWLGIELPAYEDREVGRYKWEYRMVRRSRAYWESYYDICGEWKPTKKAAKASYKQALIASKALREAV